MRVVVATADLMTGSRFRAAVPSSEVLRSADAVLEALAAGDVGLVVVDLQAFPELPEQIAAARIDPDEVQIIGFAPHVQTDLIAAGRASCDVVLARGGAIRRFAELAAAATAGGSGADG